MKPINNKILGLFLIIMFQNCFSQGFPGEIVFYSNGSTFSPLITVQGQATILWTFNDSTTSSSLHPQKDYGTEGLRINRLKVTPWSVIRGINIGYDASDGGSDTIPFIPNQKVSKIINLNLVAQYLELWCSAYNPVDSLNFNNFIKLKNIECFRSEIQKISLKNTSNLKRLCIEGNNLNALDISGCTTLEDLRAAINDYTNIIFSNSTEELFHICISNNPQITNQYFFSNMQKLPNIKALLISDCNQCGKLGIHQTNDDSIYFASRDNKYTSMDFSGAFQKENGWAFIDLYGNDLVSVNLSGCDQIKRLNLQDNNLSSDSVDKILKQLDDFGTNNGHVDLRWNGYPTSLGYSYARNLESKGWIVYTANRSLIKVFGNGNEILDGDSIPSVLNFTDFDSLNVTGGSIAHNFVIKNAGTTDLRLLGANFLFTPPYVSIQGTNASDFNVITEPSPIIIPGDSTLFKISFDPSDYGLRTAVVSIPNNNWEHAPFNFNIQGKGIIVTSSDENTSNPNRFELSQNYPNPFNPTTRISFSIPNPENVIIRIYDIMGCDILLLVDKVLQPGNYEYEFNGDGLPSGIYFYKMSAGNFSEIKKMQLLK